MEFALEIIKILPSILLVFFLIVLVILFYRPIRDLLPQITGVKAMGVELSFARKSLDDAITTSEEKLKKAMEKGEEKLRGLMDQGLVPEKLEISKEQRELAITRAKKHLDILIGTQILWVDDHPEHNVNERRMLGQLRVGVDTAKSTQEALAMLWGAEYDLVISDIARGESPIAGLEFLEHLRRYRNTLPVIFFIGLVDPTKGIPPSAFGITNRPDELLHLIIDAIERKRT